MHLMIKIKVRGASKRMIISPVGNFSGVEKILNFLDNAQYKLYLNNIQFEIIEVSWNSVKISQHPILNIPNQNSSPNCPNWFFLIGATINNNSSTPLCIYVKYTKRISISKHNESVLERIPNWIALLWMNIMKSKEF